MDAVWIFGDICNAFLARPNLIALVLLSPVVVGLTKDDFSSPHP